MRIVELGLIAFGPFERRTLDLSPRPDGLWIVYGPNEAGKSTCLRAVDALLFGVEERTTDDHLHPMKALRIAGKLRTKDGRTLEVVRKKGRKGTLTAPSGEAVDEVEMTRMLHGVDRALFRALYGLDHVRLREGARALLEARGGLGESLFEAGLAGAGVAKLGRALREEAERIWSPRATSKPLADSLRGLATARREARKYSTSHEAYGMQLQGIEAARAARDEADAELHEIDVAARRLERGIKLAPLLRARRAAVLRREALGSIVVLPEGSRDERERALAARAEAGLVIEASAAAVLRVKAALSDEAGTDLPFDATEAAAALAELAGAAREHARRVQGLEVERAALQMSIASRADRGEPARTSRAEEAALVAAVRRRDEAAARVRALVAERESVRAARARTDVELAAAPRAEVSTEELARLLADAEQARARDVERVDARRRAASASARALAARAALGGFSGTHDELAAMSVPSEDEIDLWLRQRDRHRSAAEAHLAEVERLAGRRAVLDRERAELLARGDVPTQGALDAARRERDDAIARSGDARTTGDEPALFALVRRADDIADRLRHEAERAARLAGIDADIADIESRLAERRGDAARAAAEAEAVAAGCAERFARAGALGIDLESARPWLAQRRAAVTEHLAAEENRAIAEAIGSQVDAAARALASVLGREAAGDLAAEIARARTEIEARRVAADAVARLRKDARDLEREEIRLAGALATAEHEIAATAASAASLLGAVGAAPDAPADLVDARLADAREARRALERLAEIRAQMEASSRASAALHAEVERIAPWVGLGPQASAEELIAALRRAQRAGEARRSLGRALEEESRRALEAQDRLATADAVLAALSEKAGVPVADLPDVERKSALARELDTTIREAEAAIAALGDGAPVADLERDYLDLDVDEAGAALDELAERRRDVERRKETASHNAIALQRGLEEKLDESKAAEHAADAESHLARARALFGRYVRLKIASVVLEREIETYRRDHQGPVLERAGALFARLTRGVYRGIVVGLDDHDEPEIVCLRGEEEVRVEGLSDGARDQLYLALRLATIERHASRVEPLVMVLDDVLVNFDDDRSRAALAVLSELAPEVQVLLFTHHRRVLELARETVAEERLGWIEL
jgi:uncharacterized protein YhaN